MFEVRNEAGPIGLAITHKHTALWAAVVWEIRVEVEWTMCLRPTLKERSVSPCASRAASRPEPTKIKHTVNPGGLFEPEPPLGSFSPFAILGLVVSE